MDGIIIVRPNENAMRVASDTTPRYTFGYLDESATSQRYFGCGMLVHGPDVSGVLDKRLNEHIRSLKVAAGIRLRGDVAWKKTPSRDGQYLTLYRRYIEGFFRQPALSFHAIVVDTHRYPLDSRTFFRGSKDAGIDAFAFQLLRSRLLPRIPAGAIVRLKFDRRCRPHDQGLRSIGARLRQCAATAYPDDPPAIRLASVEGGRHPLVQVADVLLGCVTASLNGNTQSRGKLALIDLLTQKLRRNPADPTPLWEQQFSVWHFEARSGATNQAEKAGSTLPTAARGRVPVVP
jgi:hypothetical protein